MIRGKDPIGVPFIEDDPAGVDDAAPLAIGPPDEDVVKAAIGLEKPQPLGVGVAL